MPGVDTLLSVTWYCGYFYGPPKWHGTEHYEPDECGEVFTTHATVGDWEESLATADCPKCKAVLYQTDDCPEIDVDVGGVVRSEDRVRCPGCDLWLGNLVVFQDPTDWMCPNCGVRFGIIVF